MVHFYRSSPGTASDSITCLGRAMAQTMRENSSARPGNRFLARAYPAMEAVMQVRIIAITAMNTVFKSHRMAAGAVGPMDRTMGFIGGEKPAEGQRKLPERGGAAIKQPLKVIQGEVLQIGVTAYRKLRAARPKLPYIL